RSRHLQGRVKVQFTLGPNGRISKLKLARESRHPALNQAALEAVQRAVPFPVPPPHLLKTPMTLRVSILFELT
ncbi:MAG: energy transducer TonB, partial [Desulfobacterales bacterium]|nr:energy transducer TonB [Desulfobacterales bacterium]